MAISGDKLWAAERAAVQGFQEAPLSLTAVRGRLLAPLLALSGAVALHHHLHAEQWRS